MPAEDASERSPARLLHNVALCGLVLYVAFAPHSVAVSAIGISIATVGWLLRSVSQRSLGLTRSKFDLVILLSILWTILTAVFSEEPQISIPKLTALWSVLIFYLTRAIVSRRTVLMLVGVLILSGVAGTLYSAFDLARGRGVIVESVAYDSPFRQLNIRKGDAIWRVNGKRVYSVSDIDAEVRATPTNTPLSVSFISQGEHVERKTIGPLDPSLTKSAGITGGGRSHFFRASGWTRHYETFSEVLQIIALLALGVALAHFRNHGVNKYFKLAFPAVVILAIGITFTTMRTVLVSFVIGASLIAWRSLSGLPKIIFASALVLLLGLGVFAVFRTRAQGAITLADPSSSLRVQIARVGLSRIKEHPILGHGMDAMKLHWNEWGFPGRDLLHLHSTPLQLAFDRGLPMLALWLWMMAMFWITLFRSSKDAADLSDTNAFGIQLGSLGALTGFLASSVVNYNYGDGEVVMLFWWVMGVALMLSDEKKRGATTANRPMR